MNFRPSFAPPFLARRLSLQTTARWRWRQEMELSIAADCSLDSQSVLSSSNEHIEVDDDDENDGDDDNDASALAPYTDIAAAAFAAAVYGFSSSLKNSSKRISKPPKVKFQPH